MNRLSLLTFVVALALLAIATAQGALQIETEDGRLQGGVRLATEISGYSGRAYLSGFIRPDDAVDLSVSLSPSESGYFRLGLRYACDADKRIPISVNGKIQANLLFPKTTGFETRDHGRVLLQSGENIIRIGTDWGYTDIDCILLSKTSPPDNFSTTTDPANPAVSNEARQLHTLLSKNFGHRTYSGQHESSPKEMQRLDYISRLTEGKKPAILGLDMIFYSPAWEKEDGDDALKKALWWSREQKGIVTLSWHWLSPFGATGHIWESFNTNKTSFDVRRIADETSPEYLAVIRDLDHMAKKLAMLRDAGVPVLWRPLHEAEGGWFWWGAHGPEPTKHLYRLMFERFTRLHQLNNLLWVWTSTADADALTWYPGNNVVDFIVADLYVQPGMQGDFFTSFDRLREIYAGRKPLALGECDILPDLTVRAPWLWFLVWDDFICRANINSPTHITRTYQNPRLVHLEQHLKLTAEKNTPSHTK